MFTDKKEQMTYFGSDLSRAQYDILGLQIDPAHRVDLPDLLRSRWFDYWALHPVQATYLFTDLYKSQVRKFSECYVDIETADEARTFAGNDIFRNREMTPMWLARSAADRVGCPYETALAFAQSRALDRTFRRFPRPNQLYGEEFEMDLKDHWVNMCGYGLQYSRSERFSASRHPTFESAPPDVKAHAAFLIKQIAARAPPRSKILGRMFKEDRLSPGPHLPFTPAEIGAAEAHAAELKCV